MKKDYTEEIMTIICESGVCRSSAMEAIAKAKEFDFDGANELLEEAEKCILGAHRVQTELIQQEAGGLEVPINLLMVHCQDHLMTSMLCKDMAREFVELYKKLDEK